MMCLQGLHFLKEDKTNQRLIYKSLTLYIGIKKELQLPLCKTCGEALQSSLNEQADVEYSLKSGYTCLFQAPLKMMMQDMLCP